MSGRPADCIAADDALGRGAWEEARHAFTASLAERESPEALEGLGVAAWWLDLADVVFDARERAYRLFLERDDRAGAAGGDGSLKPPSSSSNVSLTGSPRYTFVASSSTTGRTERRASIRARSAFGCQLSATSRSPTPFD